MTVYYRYKDWTAEDVRPIDCAVVALELREADRREIFACTADASACCAPYGNLDCADAQGACDTADVSICRAIVESVRGSRVCFCVKRNGAAVMLFGVARRALLGDEHVVWALASEEIERAPFVFLRHCRRVVERLNEVFPVMVNFVGVWNEQSLRWLRWCGFRVLDARRIGIHGEWFYPVIKRRV
ncbi:hypothetical protein [Cloacibacillus evryensis]|uniref:N-acetyltransferase domain-containing protein n=1 Tax=Cloacibacillus evryensis TaxID=508460 RepID=A0AAW5JYC7_9BACT|nr:hypothetical protein [Cloacibacillus evryensis]MCQ4813570.1 hypothetical protein [Cloacibacillus evryensis]